MCILHLIFLTNLVAKHYELQDLNCKLHCNEYLAFLIVAFQGISNLWIDVYHTPSFWIFSGSYLVHFNDLYVLRKNNFHASCTPCQTEVNSKVPIKIPDLYFSFPFWSLNSFYCGDHITDPKYKLVETNILQFHMTFSTGNKCIVLLLFQVLNITWFYGNSFTGVAVQNTLLRVSVCVYIHIPISMSNRVKAVHKPLTSAFPNFKIMSYTISAVMQNGFRLLGFLK